MQKYLYLTQVQWTSAWVHGGLVPLSLASKYKSMDRDGVYTPDENLIHESNYDLLSLNPHISFGDPPNAKHVTIKKIKLNGMLIPDIVDASLYTEDGLIQSFCNVFDVNIAKRFGKAACVRIHDIDGLRNCINKQLGGKARYGDCFYTKGHQRGHFLKSSHDAWQKEYRFFWRSKRECSVMLPAGVAEVVWTS